MRSTSRQNILMAVFCAVSCAGLVTGSYLRAQTPTTLSDLAIASVAYLDGQTLPPVTDQVVAVKVTATNNVGTADVSFLSAIYPSTLQPISCIPYAGQGGVSTCLLPPLITGQQMYAILRFRVLDATCGQNIPILFRVFNSMTDVNTANNIQVFSVAMPACTTTSSSSSSTSVSSSSSSTSSSVSSTSSSSSSSSTASSASSASTSAGTTISGPLAHAIAFRQLFMGFRNTFGFSQGQQGYDATFDFDGNGNVEFMNDFVTFNNVFGPRCANLPAATVSAASARIYGAFMAALGSQSGNPAFRAYFNFNGNTTIDAGDIPYMNTLMADIQECILATAAGSSSSSSI